MTDLAEPDVWLSLPTGPWTGSVPAVSVETAPYWKAVHDNHLDVLRCQNCGHWIHYPVASCRICHSLDVAFETVQGRGRIHTFTVVHRQFTSGLTPPFAAVLVELDEQKDLRIMSNLVNAHLSEVGIGLDVEAIFYKVDDDLTLPFFQPVGR
jgi:hypothetical protein